MGQVLTHTAKACTQTTKHVDTPMDTNRSQPPSHHHHLSPCNQGPHRPPATLATVHSEVLRSWPHMWVPQGCMEGISLSERAPTRPSCYDPPSCGHISSCPSSRCEPEGHLEAPMSVCVCRAHSSVGNVTPPGTWRHRPVNEMDRPVMPM